MNQNPLVTVGVVTYNSGEFIESTLDSIKDQDYKNIELVISDDCSTDDTVHKCQSWIENNGNRFVRVKLVTTSINTGVSGNSNRALSEAHGKWYKCFDGDDILLPHAISSYVEFACNHHDAKQIVAKVEHFNETSELVYSNNMVSKYVCRPSATAKTQLSVITKALFFECPSFFACTETIRKVGAFDERFPMQEDYPLMVRMIAAGNKMYYIDKPMVRYRERLNSISHSKDNEAIFSNNAIRMLRDYRMEYRKEYSNFFWQVLNSFSLILPNIIIKQGNSKHSILCSTLYCIYKLVDPYMWYLRVLRFYAYIYYKITNNKDNHTD